MKTAILLFAVIALATAFDFPEDWEAWKEVGYFYYCSVTFIISRCGLDYNTPAIYLDLFLHVLKQQ